MPGATPLSPPPHPAGRGCHAPAPRRVPSQRGLTPRPGSALPRSTRGSCPVLALVAKGLLQPRGGGGGGAVATSLHPLAKGERGSAPPTGGSTGGIKARVLCNCRLPRGGRAQLRHLRFNPLAWRGGGDGEGDGGGDDGSSCRHMCQPYPGQPACTTALPLPGHRGGGFLFPFFPPPPLREAFVPMQQPREGVPPPHSPARKSHRGSLHVPVRGGLRPSPMGDNAPRPDTADPPQVVVVCVPPPTVGGGGGAARSRQSPEPHSPPPPASLPGTQ